VLHNATDLAGSPPVSTHIGSEKADARPCGALAMTPEVAQHVFTPAARARLDTLLRCQPAIFTRPEQAAELLADVEVLVTGWGCPGIDEVTLAAAPKLRAVIHAAGSVKEGRIAPVVWQRGIAVSSAAEVNARPVAQYTMAAILLAGKRAFSAARSYADSGYPTFGFAADTGNAGRTVGVVGASRIGRLVLAELPAHGYEVLVADPYLTVEAAAALGAELVGLDELMRRSDVATLHAPLLPETRHLIDDRRMSLMRDGGIIINTGRGALIDTEALLRHCAGFPGRAGRLDAVLDVTDPEPLPAGHPLFALPNVLVTPHIAGALGTEVSALGDFAVAEVARYLRAEPLQGAVALDDLTRIA
jgi:phosphoglycerate dehydrogenase-like enzyme